MIRQLWSWIKRLLLFTLLWLVLSGGTRHDLPIALLGIAAATACSIWLWPPGTLKPRWQGLPRLTAYFLVSSLKGGVDIAWRALAPSMPLQPEIIALDSKLKSQPAIVLFAWLISLMPGTASVQLEQGNTFRVHVVDLGKYGEARLRELEDRIAGFLP